MGHKKGENKYKDSDSSSDSVDSNDRKIHGNNSSDSENNNN